MHKEYPLKYVNLLSLQKITKLGVDFCGRAKIRTFTIE